jgi:hypothetical protein
MAVPSYYSSDFLSRTLFGISDVQDWMDAIRDTLLNLLPVASRWSEPVLNTLRTPVDPVTGYFMQLVLARTTATRMRFAVYDQNLLLVLNGEADLPTGNETIRIVGGPQFCYTWSQTSSEFGFCTMVDPSPEAPNAPVTVVYGKTTRYNPTGVAFGFYYWPDLWNALDGIVSTVPQGRFQGPWFVINSGTLQFFTAGGSIMYLPVSAIAYADGTFGAPRFTGHALQLAWVDQLIGARFQMSIDAGVVGTFEKLPLLTQGSGNYTQTGMLGVRVA